MTKHAFVLYETPADAWSAPPKLKGVVLNVVSAEAWVKDNKDYMISRSYSEVPILYE